MPEGNHQANHNLNNYANYCSSSSSNMQDAFSPRDFAHPYARFPSIILEAETAKEEEKTPKPEDLSGLGQGASADTLSKPPEEQILFVESKYCTICNIE